MATFVAFLALDGSAVILNPDLVIGVAPVPANLLPAGVPAGTYIFDGDGQSRLSVQGTPAAVASALGGAGPSVASAAFVGATGVLSGGENVIATDIVRNGAGDYTVTLTQLPNIGVPFVDWFVVVSIASGGPRFFSADNLNGGAPCSFDILTFDSAGAAADTFNIQFSVHVFP